MNNQSKGQQNFNGNNRDKVQSGQTRRDDFSQKQNQKSTGAQRDISPDSKRRAPTDSDLTE